MSETLVWLVYCLAGAIAFAAIHYRNWPITAAMITGAGIATLIWFAGVQLGREEEEPTWITLELTMNATFALIFAGAGAALAHFLRMRRGEP